MFDQTFVDTGARTRKPFTVAASFTVQSILVVAALILPLFHPRIIQPRFDLEPPLFLTRIKPLPPPSEPIPQDPSVKVSRRLFSPRLGPIKIPPVIDMTSDLAPDISDPGFAGPAMSQLPGLISDRPPAPDPSAPTIVTLRSPQPLAPVRVSEGVQAAKLIFGPKPVYPRLAVTARIQGTVTIHALIARDGTIKNLQVTSGPPLLIRSAIEAVQRWRYQPTLLTGEPVEVITEIAVNFTLN